MKVHSYCAVNGYLSSVDLKYTKALTKLQQLCSSESSIGSWDRAVNVATARRAEGLRARDNLANQSNIVDFGSTFNTSPEGSTPARTPSSEIQSMKFDTTQPAQQLRQRLQAIQTGPVVTNHPAAQNPPMSAVEDEFAENRHILCHHPDSRVSDLANILTDLDAELTTNGGQGNKGPVRWPDNVTLWNFMDYMLIPTLVYEMQYPRTAT